MSGIRSPMEIDEEEDEGERDDYEGMIKEIVSHRLLRNNIQIETKIPNLYDTSSLKEEYHGISGFQRCRSVDHYKWIHNIDEGTYGCVSRARDKKTEEIVVLKKLKFIDKHFVKNGFPLKFLREIHLLMTLRHDNIVPVREIVVGSTMDKIYLCMDFVEHTLRELLIEMKKPFPPSEVKYYLRELLRGVAFLHQNNVLHRDIKSSNILVGGDGQVKLCDFGLSRIYEKPANNRYTPLVVTLWYRPVELLLGKTEYGPELDVWGVGCIFYELVTKNVLFEGNSEIDQIIKIFKTLGKPNPEMHPTCFELMRKSRFTFQSPNVSSLPSHFNGSICPPLSEAGLDLMTRLLHYEPSQRISAKEALDHVYFTEAPLPKERIFLQTFRSTNTENLQRKKRRRDEERYAKRAFEKSRKRMKQM